MMRPIKSIVFKLENVLLLRSRIRYLIETYSENEEYKNILNSF